jgi:hypothetical protein
VHMSLGDLNEIKHIPGPLLYNFGLEASSKAL